MIRVIKKMEGRCTAKQTLPHKQFALAALFPLFQTEPCMEVKHVNHCDN